ncbi:hypothetical protein ACFO5R_02415 [Halosolutus amylolyticus]|uniref:Uncharacterized protein n=1 Tax=Halosolutus amylolyticus TaxID=2932267 RepID=A0ABD5PJL5_9EURY|nr:hypothetical protein [Halosolutus amylolyticus]
MVKISATLSLLVGLVAGVERIVIGSDIISSAAVVLIAVFFNHIDRLLGDPVHVALAFCAWYLLGVITYHPQDKKEYRAAKKPSNKSAEHLELSYALILAIVPTGFFVLVYYLNAPGILAFGAVVVASVLAGRRWLDAIAHIFTKSADRTRSSFYRDARNSIYMPLTGLLIVLAAIALVFGTLAAFLFHLVWMLFVARRLRWVVYEDLYGFRELSPSPLKWGLVARVPLMYAVVVVVFERGLSTESAVFTSFAPLVVGVSYVAYRHAVLDGFDATPYGKYEQMDEKEKRHHQMNSGWIALTGGRKAPNEKEQFQNKVGLMNYQIRIFNNVHRDRVKRQHGVRLPRLRTVAKDVDAFDPRSHYKDFEAYKENLHDLPFHEADDITRQLDDLRRELRDVEEFYETWVAPYKNWEPPENYF